MTMHFFRYLNERNMRKIFLNFLWVIFFVSLIPFHAQVTDAQGRKQGYWKKKDEKTGKILYEGEFKDDKPVGKFIHYYPGDTVRRAVMYYYDGGRIAYANLYHQTTGKIMAQGKYVNEKKDSVWTYYDEGGIMISKETWKEGMKEGKSFVYLDDGQIVEECSYKNDKKHGPYKQYYPDKRIKCEGTYENGEKHSKFTWYYPDGKIYQVGNYINGKPEGVFLIFEKDGKIKEKQVFANGQLLKGKQAEEYEKKLKSSGTSTNTPNKAASKNTAEKKSPQKK